MFQQVARSEFAARKPESLLDPEGSVLKSQDFGFFATFGASLSGNSIVQYNFLILALYSKSHRILKHLLYPRDAVLNTLKFIRPETTCTKSKEEPFVDGQFRV